MLEPLDWRQRLGLDLVEATQVAGQRVHLALDRLATQILEVIVVGVHAVERRVGRMRLVEIGEQIVDEMGQWFRNDHRAPTSNFGGVGSAAPAVPIRQWYNKLRVLMPGTLFVVATPIGNLEDITARALRVLREASIIAAEDTRRTAHLLARYAITTPTTSLHEHNEAQKIGLDRRAARARRERRAGVGRRDADDFRSRAAADPGGDRGRYPGRVRSRDRARPLRRWRRRAFRATRSRSLVSAN